MKTLLVVEDEKMIRRGICTIASRSGVPIEEILECGNGEEALKIITERDIDVVFTDIRMPKMDGIELVQQVQKLEKKPFMVAISGYDDFSYAVEMLRNGVKEYILKPVDRNKIAEILQKLDEEISQASDREKNDIELGKQQLKYLLTNEPASEHEINLLKSKFDSIFYQNEYVVCCSNHESQNLDYKKGLQISGVGDYDVYIIEADRVEEIKEELSDSFLGISKKNVGIENIREAFLQAVAARKKAFCLGKNVSADEELPRAAEALKLQAAKLLEEQEMSHRLQLIGTDKTEELIKYWEKLFSAVEKQQIEEEAFEAAQERFIEEVMRLYRSAMSEAAYAKLNEYRHLLSFNSINEYKESIMNWILDLNDSISNRDYDSLNDQKMKMALDFIQENYNTDINMAVVSNHISMNYSLFSFSFKQYTGKNFVNYLKDLRINEAKRMLAETDEKVIDISQMIGYDNEKHFMKTFKAYCGVSPSEYRKNMQRK